MGRFVNEQNRVCMLYESGTYGTTSGTAAWIGKITSNSMTENQNVQEVRFLGATGRGVAQFDNTARDYEGTLTYYPQNFKLMGFTLGSMAFTSGASNTHAYSPVVTGSRLNAFTSGTLNPFVSFQVEDGKVTQAGSLTRTATGCVSDTFTLSASQGEIAEVELNYRAQSMTDSTNAPSAVTAIGSRVYMWKDMKLDIPSGTTIESLKEVSLEIANNFSTPHYLNGSEVIGVPIPGNLDVTLTGTIDLQTENLGLFNNYFRSGTEFNAILDMNANPAGLAAIGSQHTVVILSGCRMTSFDMPSEIEDVNEVTFEMKTGSILVKEYNQYQHTPW